MKRSGMSRISALVAPIVAAVFAAGTALAHEGHGATPAHLHPVGDFPIDIGAIVIVGVAVAFAGAFVLARANHRR